LTDAPAALSRRTSLPRLIGFSGLITGIAMAGVAQTLFLPRFYASTVGLDLAAVGFAFSIVRLIDVGIDPFLGVMMDRFNSPIGKYRPWILASAPILMIATWQLFVPPAGAGIAHIIIWSLVFALGGSMFNLAQAAWASNLASDYKERPRVFGWMQIMGILAAMVFLLLGAITQHRIEPSAASSMPTIALMIIILIPISFLIGTAVTPDRPIVTSAASSKVNLADYWAAICKPDMVRLILADFVLTLGPGLTGPIYLFFFHDVKQFSYAIATLLIVPYGAAGLLGAPVWSRVAAKFGKHRLIQIACVLYGITQTILMVLPPAMLIPTAISIFSVGFCVSAFVIAIRSMVADLADAALLERGKDQTSVLFAMVTTTTKIGASITTGVTFGILAAVGYTARQGVVNTPQAIFGLEMVYLFAPILLVFVGAAIMIGYKLDANAHADIRKKLGDRNVAASSAG
jgi:GPH family glycoside/pentoside/hexuronide:cation symporter